MRVYGVCSSELNDAMNMKTNEYEDDFPEITNNDYGDHYTVTIGTSD